MPRLYTNSPRNIVECPNCGGDMVRTVDSRPTVFEGVKVVRRRRRCEACAVNITTLEIPEAMFSRARGAALKAKIAELTALMEQL